MGWHISDESDEFSQPITNGSNMQLFAAVDEIAQLRLQLAAANQAAAELLAEVNQWRGAVRWEQQGNDSYTLRLAPAESKPRYDLGGVTEYRDGWMAWRGGGRMQGPSPDRNAACAKVCELLGLPVVLPVGEGE